MNSRCIALLVSDMLCDMWRRIRAVNTKYSDCCCSVTVDRASLTSHHSYLYLLIMATASTHPGKSWNLFSRHGKSYKMTVVM